MRKLALVLSLFMAAPALAEYSIGEVYLTTQANIAAEICEVKISGKPGQRTVRFK